MRVLVRAVDRAAGSVLRGLIRFYQLAISPWTTPSCKYYPTCSNYALTAVQTHGAVKGGWLAVKRLGRCNPFSQGGVDYVPGSVQEQIAERIHTEVSK